MPKLRMEVIDITGISPRDLFEKMNPMQNNAPPASCSTSLKNNSKVNELGNACEVLNKTPTPAKALVNSKDDLSGTKSPSSNSLPLEQNCHKENLQASQGAAPNMAKSQISNEFGVLMASAEDVQMQNMAAEFMQVGEPWQEKLNNIESHYKQQLDECHMQIADLRAKNTTLKKSIENQVEQIKVVDLARQTIRDDIVQLEGEPLSTFAVLSKSPNDKNENPNVIRGEQELEVKNLKRQLSELSVSIKMILENNIFTN